jgi:hypothetical protein
MILPILIGLFLSMGSGLANTGHSIAGAVTLSGFMKSLVMKHTIPLGGLTSYYGYESLSFPTSTPVYCFSGVALSSSGSILGASFGGNGTRTMTIGKCRDPKDYLGGFLNLSLAYDIGKGSKDASVQATFSLGFDLKAFNQKILDSYRDYGNDPRTVRTRVRQAALHFIKYAGLGSVKKLGKHYLWLKLLSLPLITVAGEDWKLRLNDLKFTVAEMKELEKRQNMFALKEDMIDLFYNVKRDPDFYRCSGKYSDCEKIYVDAFYLMDALELAMGECHAVSIGLNLMSSYDVKIPFLTSKLNFSFGYSYFGLKETLPKDKNTSLAATGAFASHRLWKKNASCEGIEKVSASSFGEFLGLLGVGGR